MGFRAACLAAAGAGLLAYLALSGEVGTEIRQVSGSTASNGGLQRGVTSQQIDGGPHYFANLHPASAWMDTTMLLGGWDEEPLNSTELGYDAAMKNNMYWALAGIVGDQARQPR